MMNINDKKCPKCGETGNIDSKFFCHACGAQLKYHPEKGLYMDDFIPCPECKQLNSNKVNFCTKCGSTLSTVVVTLDDRKRGPFHSLYAKFVAVGVALLLGIGLTWSYFHFADNGSANGPRIDVVFCIDTTGSMGDEIENVKAQLQNMVRDIQQGNPRPVVRLGIVAFKDIGDEYVVKSYPLSDNVREAQNIIDSLSARGGGDHEESVSQALHVAVEEMNWDMTQGVGRMLFLIGDAGPHMDYDNGYDYRKEIDAANSKSIMITTIGCSGIDSGATGIFQDIASRTNGAFDYLTYRQAYVNERGEEKVVLYQGGKSYVVDDKYKGDSSWIVGARDLEKEKKVEALSESIAPSASTVVSGECFKDSDGGSYRTKTEAENNLGQFMNQQVRNQAVKQGVTY